MQGDAGGVSARGRLIMQLPGRWLLPYAASLLLVGCAAVLARLSLGLASASSLTLIFLVAVVISANRFGLWPAVFTSVLGVLSWDYFFTLPYYSLRFDDPRDAFTLVTFLIVSLVVSGMAEQIRRQNDNLAALADSLGAANRHSQTLLRLATIDEIANFTVSQLSEMFSARAVVMLRDHAAVQSRLLYPAGEALSRDDIAAAERVVFPLSRRHDAAAQTRGDFTFVPFEGLRGRLGTIGLARPDHAEFSEAERQRLGTFMSQAAIAFERAWFSRDVERSHMVAETERARNALLTSVSHDLRTPLTAIIGALSTLSALGDSIEPEVRTELIDTARSEAERLNRFVGNLLDITRLEAGGLSVSLSPVDVDEVVASARERAGDLLSHHKIDVSIPDDLPEVLADPVLLEQVIFNVLDNAAKYAPSGSTIRIGAARRGDGSVVLSVADEGPGIPEKEPDRIFEKFTRFNQGDSVAPGTGLGLMICRGFMSVMNGTIQARNRTDRKGAEFDIGLTTRASL